MMLMHDYLNRKFESPEEFNERNEFEGWFMRTRGLLDGFNREGHDSCVCSIVDLAWQMFQLQVNLLISSFIFI